MAGDSARLSDNIFVAPPASVCYQYFAMTGLRDFIAKRRSEIHTEMAKLRAELEELQAAERAVSSSAATVDNMPVTPPPSFGTTSSDGMTIKQYVMDILVQHASGLTAREIITAICDAHGVAIERTSLSPQLSRLKSEGKITLIGRKWHVRRGRPAASYKYESPDKAGLSQEVGESEQSETSTIADDPLGKLMS